MNSYTISYPDILVAYKKMKSNIFYSNNSTYYKVKCALFERSNIEEKLLNIQNILQLGVDSQAWKDILKKITYFALPKKFESEDDKSGYFVFNSGILNNNKVESIYYYIDCPFEIHVISMLWVIKRGSIIDKQLGPEIFGNRLRKTVDGRLSEKGLSSFEMYFIKYTKWRDLAIEKSIQLHNSGRSSSIICLDFKDYYHTIDLQKSLFESIGSSPYSRLDEYIYSISSDYSIKLNKSNRILPIGLVSSNVLGNYYLKDYDKEIVKKFNPVYYGRYVDDIIMVIDSTNTGDGDRILPKELVSKLNIQSSGKITHKELNITISKEKMKIYNFHAKDSISVLEEFKRNIRKNSSEFKFLPTDEDIESSFDENLLEINYSDSINKLRSLEGIHTNRYEISKKISKLLSYVNNIKAPQEHDFEKINKNLENIMLGNRLFEIQFYWEKILTYYAISANVNAIIAFVNDLLDRIVHLKYGKDLNNEDINNKIISSTIELLLCSFISAVSLRPALMKERKIRKAISNIRTSRIKVLFGSRNISQIQSILKVFINSNMMRQSLITIPLLNYCNYQTYYTITDNESDIEYYPNKMTHYRLDEKKMIYSPRKIHFEEIMQFIEFKYGVFGRSLSPERKIKLANKYSKKYRIFHSNKYYEKVYD
ncbi:hypothetical protein EFP84_18955 [Leptospira kmetyi]|uniref:Reverse transcriptase domain-containing protein n=1 Tax=Leptospira kmetyi TaxID=408139 RepID=A0AAD0UWZ5_9LEPT|nr:RNA-directed DNA polymerase [Leptospira kmetyi]AYV57717.1 hypothetical protein EFP84_18955 [Leptospira kmetyi]